MFRVDARPLRRVVCLEHIPPQLPEWHGDETINMKLVGCLFCYSSLCMGDLSRFWSASGQHVKNKSLRNAMCPLLHFLVYVFYSYRTVNGKERLKSCWPRDKHLSCIKIYTYTYIYLNYILSLWGTVWLHNWQCATVNTLNQQWRAIDLWERQTDRPAKLQISSGFISKACGAILPPMVSFAFRFT